MPVMSSIRWDHIQTLVGQMFFAFLHLRLRADVDHSQFGGYSLVTNTWWLFWTHSPVEWKGANTVGGDVNVPHAWKVPGDVSKEAGTTEQSKGRVWAQRATQHNRAQQSTAQRGSGPAGFAGVAVVAWVNKFNINAFPGLHSWSNQGKTVVRLGRLGQQVIWFPSPPRDLPPGRLC